MEHQDNQLNETESGINSWWIIIIGLLFLLLSAMIILPNRIRAEATGAFTQCQSNCKNLGTVLEMYADDNNGTYPAKLSMLTPDYLWVIPTCRGYEAKYEIKKRKRPSYCDTYTVSDDFSAYTFYCGSRDHDVLGIPDNYPQYNSAEGLISRD